ncbi:rRNA pseudouridine synthase [Patescibacteria group bacterium]|nr:rRNA pseudouridine synthase [Patescibacteria group bacterium]
MKQQENLVRINKFISQNTEYSRRKADELIDQGKVKLNGKIVDSPGVQIDPQNDRLEIDNISIKVAPFEKTYIALHKPMGFVTTRNDEMGRQTVMDLIPKNKNLKPIGRLDKKTEGLLLLSNDGDFINRLTHPRFECDKTYLAEISDPLDPKDQELLEKGVRIDRKVTYPAEIELIQPNLVKIKIHEGRNRQIRKMFELLGYTVKYLKRIQIGGVSLGALKKGAYRNLTKSEVNAYKSA